MRMYIYKIFIGLTVFLGIFTVEADNKLRPKRQDDDRWSWGYVDTNTESARLISTEIPETTTEFNPCNVPDPVLPDFRAPGRRISETKCLEYIWNIKSRVAKYEKNVACVVYAVAQARKKGQFIGAAIGGRPAFPGEFPHMAGIGWKAAVGTWVFKCGGSLISDRFVLTAAHCSRASSVDTTIDDIVPRIVRMGDKNIIDTRSKGYLPKDFNISRIIVHPQYKSPKKYFDIALMELDRVVTFDSLVQPGCLWSNFDTSSLGQQAAVTGWGVVETATRTTSPELQVAVVDFVDSQTCDTLLRPSCNRHWCGIIDGQICAGKLAGGVDACQGDSGGPLQVKINLPKTQEGMMHHIIGVTSFGFGCALAETPGVYTRVAEYIDWIEGIVWLQQ